MTPKKRLILTDNPVELMDVDLLEAQKKFFREFIENGFEELFDEINPIEDYTGSNWALSFEDVNWEEAKLGFREAHNLGLTHDAPVFVTVKLVNKRTGEIKKQKIFLCDMPLMSNRASFMVNGNERVVVFQIIRSEGVLFSEAKASTPAKKIYSVKLMPNRGKWYEFEMNKYGVMSVKLLEKRPRILLTTLLRAMGYGTDEELKKVLGDVDTGEVKYLENTLRKDPTSSTEEALIEIYRKLRPEDSITLENARSFLDNMFFNKRRFYLGKIGRYKLNQKLGDDSDITMEDYLLKKKDIVELVKALIQLNNGTRPMDDIDSLGNRRVRGINEIVGEKIRVGMLIMEKNIRDRMSTYSTDEKVTPAMLVNTKPVIAAINQFFGSSALMRYMDQENILSELEVKRKVTAGGPRGLTKERATFSVRDVHDSHYGRLCPVTTPEGPSVGMVNQLAVYSKINDFGFLEAPYFKVVKEFDVKNDKVSDFKGRMLRETINNVGKKGDEISSKIVDAAKKAKLDLIPLVPFITNEIEYIDSDTEAEFRIAPHNIKRDENNNIIDDQTYIRHNKEYRTAGILDIDYIDISPSQIAGLGLALIPFAGNDDPNRTFYGAKTQNQAVPLVMNESPIVGTGFEKAAAKASGRTVFAEEDGVVLEADSARVLVEYGTGKDKRRQEYEVEKFIRTNQNTSFSQRTVVLPDEKVKKGDILIDGPCTDQGELALGVNLRAAYMVWDGFNYEDGIVINEKLVKNDALTSIHIHEYTQEVRETKLGNELITSDIPGVGEKALRNLDEQGVVRIGANVDSNDILVGIIAPKGETELTAEEKLLRAIFGEYARDVRDNSLRMPYGEEGVVVGVQVLERSKGAKLNPGVLKQVKVWVARTHKISVGDKLTGYHGEKGLIAKIVPEEDMPYTADGQPVDIILGPASMIRRMNLGQLIETHIGALAHKLGTKVEVQPFAGYKLDKLIEEAKKAGIDYEEKVDLYDGRTGEKFDQKVVVGHKYVLKLDHLADHKVHARSTGPYTLVTQQPLRGKAQMGGQRLGEMEVWALQAHAVPHLLHEMLTIKSDDVVGRAAAYKAIISGQPIKSPNVPESFNVLDKELAGLGIKMDKIDAEYDFEKADMALEEIVDSVGNDLPTNE
ncbi:DNA-directed RNA polymerase subunit beta [Candidatus Dojkabacteria bacterium]|uniref:DNA-directed RNA polymerase subunit beta n=1 Tax=Candidatus Dojkabacteria bacterium TaxID=2099670 RepID=A0A955IB45_9BACT|nr:DNA-directed RNA polymerase subunit beta [Candidatus Dojkabacteria bacterium]